MSTAHATATLGDLYAALPDSDLPLVVQLPDGPMGAAFHVTEIKRATISSLDCARGTHAWQEILVQLLDGDTGPALSARKLRGILGAARADKDSGHDSDYDSALFFEGSRGNRALGKFALNDVVITEARVILEMADVRPACKPSERFVRVPKAPGTQVSAGCC